jgi:hypothetical protein
MYAVQNFDLHHVTEQLKETDHEILLLWGKEDKWHLPNNSVFYQSFLQNGRYFLVRDAGHIVQEDTPEKLYQVILSYIPSATYGYYPPQYFSYDKDTREQEVFDTGNEEQEQAEENQNSEPENAAQTVEEKVEMTSEKKEELKTEEPSSEDKNDGEL